MRPIDHLDMSVEELAERVRGPIWDRWVNAEPGLGRLSNLAELRDLRGAEADQLLGALVRLAAADGGDDELAARSRCELVEYLEWCVRGDWITTGDATLMLELVAAGWQTLDRGVLKLKRGVCSMHAVEVVADRRGVCAKTVVRERDRVLALLREARVEYFLEVA